ncbi:MAG: phenylacetate-CoA oxygenase subunit PaaJ [Gemmatimonadaceae bacterium]|nr:phenylacetate-CoA oxygenase subunit PaaJ [Gemmatimonadaceae bacterium]
MVADRETLFTWLDEVMDPEVPVLSVVELGIIRDVEIEGDRVTVVVTPTYSGCPAMQVIEEEILAALRAKGVTDARVRTVFTPAWTTEWIPEHARAKLEAYGIAPPGRATSDTLVQIGRRAELLRCPYCKSTETEVRSAFGSTACKSICWCRACRQPFEQFKAI